MRSFQSSRSTGTFGNLGSVETLLETLEVQECSGNLRSTGMFQKLRKHGNNLQTPWNASVFLETPEGHLVGILTWRASVLSRLANILN